MNESYIQINSDVDNKTVDFSVHDGLYSTRINIEKYEATLYIDERMSVSVKKFPNVVHRFFAKTLLGWRYVKNNM